MQTTSSKSGSFMRSMIYRSANCRSNRGLRRCAKALFDRSSRSITKTSVSFGPIAGG